MFRSTLRLFNTMKSVEPVPKRLIICCDGTFQSSVSGKRNIPSNVTRLARTIAKAGQDSKGKVWQQVVYYDSGIGTGELGYIETITQGATGEGLVTNVLEAYNFLVNNYSPGDQIFCFGFSRGAFTARAIAGLVTDIGVFKPSNMQAFPPLWALYRANLDKKNFRKSIDYFEYMTGVRPMVPKGQEDKPYKLKAWELPHRSELSKTDPLAWPKSNVVEVVGVFDTVGSLGKADTRLMAHAASRRPYEWLNVKLSPFINHAFHALALDERREPFLPTLWYIPDEKTLQKEETDIDKEDDNWPELEQHRKRIDQETQDQLRDHPPDLYQVWFPGVHINIGGGTDADDADKEGLSNITFAWMVQQLGPYLTFETWTWDEIGMYQQRVQAETKLYDSMKKGMTHDEEEKYGDLVERGRVEAIEHAAWKIGSSVLKAGKNFLGLSGKQELVPVKPSMIRYDTTVDVHGKDVQPQWALSEIVDSYKDAYLALSAPSVRTPGQCTDMSREAGRTVQLSSMGRTNEYIHPAVWWRYWKMDGKGDHGHYQSAALTGFKRVQDPKYKSWGYLKELGPQKIWIPEWFMKPTNEYLDHVKQADFKDGQLDEPWRHAEWGFVQVVPHEQEFRERLAQFYVDAQKAQKEMDADGKKFPWEAFGPLKKCPWIKVA